MNSYIGGSSHILVVEDEAVLAEIIQNHLTAQGFRVTWAEDGQAAWDLILAAPGRFAAILLDRAMPRMDGLALLGKIRGWPETAHIPVIMATALDDKASVLEGLNAGAYYYLTKPLQLDLLLAVVRAAVNQTDERLRLAQLVRQTEQSLDCLTSAVFHFRQIEEVDFLASLLARLSPQPERTVLGLSELMINAVEHGNLGITYDEKSRLLLADELTIEIRRRQRLPENQDKRVEVRFERLPEAIQFIVQDQGAGFDWGRYLDFDPDRMFDPNGRGVAMANHQSFDALTYQGNGNTVVVRVDLTRGG